MAHNGFMGDITIRRAGEDDFADVAEFRYTADADFPGDEVTTHDEFVDRFTEWATANRETHQCVIALRGEVIIGMAWLAVVPRVPSSKSFTRASGDIQAVYALPSERNARIGSRMIEELLAIARERGVGRVTVHSSPKAISAYARAGFSSQPILMQVAVPPEPPHCP